MTAGAGRADEAVLALLRALPDPVLIADADDVVLMANPEAARWLGTGSDELSGRPLADVLCAAPVTAVRAAATLDGKAVMVVSLRAPEHAEPEASELLAAVVRSSADAILSMGLDGLITSWNAGAERVYGYSGQEAAGDAAMLLMDHEH